MDGVSAATFGAIAAALFVTELTDKDALLILNLSTKLRAATVFFAGAVAFLFTTAVIVAAGTFLIGYVPILWVRLAGGGAMIGYGLWEARGLVGRTIIEREETRLEGRLSGWRAVLAIAGTLALLDLAGDATEVLIIVFVAHYPNALFVFSAASVGLIVATAFETALGNRLGRVLTPRRVAYGSMVVFLILGFSIVLDAIL